MHIKQSKGQRTRSQIVKVAYSLFVEQGYHGTSMRQIAHAADIALGGIYNHFSGKDDIFRAVFEAYHPYHIILPALTDANTDTAEGFVREAAAQIDRTLNQQPDFIKLVFIELVEFNGHHLPELYGIVFPQIEDILLQIPQALGDIRPIPLPILFRAFLGLFFTNVLTEMILGDEFPDEYEDEALQNLIDIYLHGILMKV
jgi:AcrR family transcriptional regulator